MRVKTRLKFVFICIVVIVLVLLSLSKILFPFARENNEIRFQLLLFYPIYSCIKFYKSMNKKDMPFTIIADDAVHKSTKKQLVVFVVGETQRSANYSLNRYTKNETNFYTKEQNVISFSEFYSCETATAVSLPCMFSDLKRGDFDIAKANSRQNLVDVISSVGIDTFWLGNNSGGCKAVCDRLIKENVKEYKAINFDEVIFKDAIDMIEKATNTTFIVLHVQGSHGPIYFKEYPDEFRRFTPTCDTAELNKCSIEEIQNTYDNTILYQDFLQSELIKALKKRENEFETAMFFISDHGESLGENGVYLHGLPYAIAPKYQKHVPFIFYSNNDAVNKRLLALKDAQFSHDYIFSSVLGYLGIKTAVYEKEFDIFSKY